MQRKFGRSLDEIQNIVDFTQAFFDTHAIDSSVRSIVDLCVEELFVNMVTYDTETDEDILIEMNPHEHGIEVSLTDFNVEPPTALLGTIETGNEITIDFNIFYTKK